MKIAVILVNYNTVSDTIACLESLKKTIPVKNISIETTVVDNGSNDGIKDELPTRYPEVKLILTGKNLGFTGGNNVGIKEALKENPTHVLLLNNDTIVEKSFLKDLSASVINNPKVGILNPLIYFAKGYEFKDHYEKSQLGKVIWAAGGSFDYENVLGSNRHVDEVDNGQFVKAEEIDFATGACMLIKVEVLKKIGFLDDRYFMYLEDVEYSQRAKNHGYKVYFDPSIKIWHKVAQSSGIGSNLNDYFITRNRLLFGYEYLKFRTKFALFRESIRKLITGTPAQKMAVKDFYLGKFNKGSFIKN